MGNETPIDPKDFIKLDFDKIKTVEDVVVILKTIGFQIAKYNPQIGSVYYLLDEEDRKKLNAGNN